VAADADWPQAALLKGSQLHSSSGRMTTCGLHAFAASAVSPSKSLKYNVWFVSSW
jgi:hypothetical protein